MQSNTQQPTEINRRTQITQLDIYMYVLDRELFPSNVVPMQIATYV